MLAAQSQEVAGNVNLAIREIRKTDANAIVIEKHYLHRKTSITIALGLFQESVCVGIITFGTPPSRHLQISACPSDPSSVIELNRLWVADEMPRNTESWFIAQALRMLPPLIVVSYADTAAGHAGYVYRAANFFYAGWTDMERKTPRFDYVTPGKHSRQSFRKGGNGHDSEKVRRRPKVKYWTITGNARDRKRLGRLVGWPKLDWRVQPPPS